MREDHALSGRPRVNPGVGGSCVPPKLSATERNRIFLALDAEWDGWCEFKSG